MVGTGRDTSVRRTVACRIAIVGAVQWNDNTVRLRRYFVIITIKLKIRFGVVRVAAASANVRRVLPLEK